MHKIEELQNQINELQSQKYNMMLKLKNTDTSGMTKQELQDFAMTLPPIREDLWEDMQNYGFQTGSSMFGVSNPADIDWVCQLPATAFTYSGCAVPCGKITKDYMDENINTFVPLYGNKDGQLYNIICISDQAKFEAWKETTQLMEGLSKGNIPLAATQTFTTKWKRVRLFRALCDVLEPVYPVYSHRRPSHDDALKYGICKICRREANNFTCKPAKDYYLETAICERCHHND